MKNLPYYACMILAATFIFAALPTDAEARIYDDTIRLHILAQSDSDEDQELKIAVRDALLLEYGEAMRSAGSFEAAESLGKTLLPEIERTAREIISERGYDYSVSASLRESGTTRENTRTLLCRQAFTAR